MNYMATSINQSPVIVDKAGAVLADVRGRAVKFDGTGAIVLAAAGEKALGVGIMTNDTDIAKNEDVHVQIKDIGLVYAGAAITKGVELEVGTNGALIPVASGNPVAIALEAATAAGVYVKAIIL